MAIQVSFRLEEKVFYKVKERLLKDKITFQSQMEKLVNQHLKTKKGAKK